MRCRLAILRFERSRNYWEHTRYHPSSGAGLNGASHVRRDTVFVVPTMTAAYLRCTIREPDPPTWAKKRGLSAVLTKSPGTYSLVRLGRRLPPSPCWGRCDRSRLGAQRLLLALTAPVIHIFCMILVSRITAHTITLHVGHRFFVIPATFLPAMVRRCQFRSNSSQRIIGDRTRF